VLHIVAIIPISLDFSFYSLRQPETRGVDCIMEVASHIEPVVVLACPHLAGHLDQIVTEDESSSLSVSYTRKIDVENRL
jgi:hypothetical protein